MAQLNNLIVTGKARFLNNINGNLVGNVTGNASSATYAVNVSTATYTKNANQSTCARSTAFASSVTYASTATSITDSTKLPLVGGALTGNVTNTGTFKSYNTADSGQYVTMGYADLINGKKWDGTNTSLISALSGKLSTNGGTMTGAITMNGKDLVLGTASTATNDSGDIVFRYGNGNEKARIWIPENPTVAVAPYYRIYNNASSKIYEGKLVGPTRTTNYPFPAGGSIIVYKYGRIVNVKINGIAVTVSSSGYKDFMAAGDIAEDECPIDTFYSEWSDFKNNSPFYIMVFPDGRMQLVAAPNTTGGYTLYYNILYVSKK